MSIRKELKEAITSGHLYDFVCNNQHRLSKDELVELVKNLDYTSWQILEPDEYRGFCKQVIENLDDYDFFEEEDDETY